MTKQVQRRRGTATQHTSFTGAEGEISVNTTNKSIHVHDGVTAGGIEGARADMTNVSDGDLNSRLAGNTLSSLTITSADINGGTIDGTVIGGSTPAAGSFTTGSFTGDVSFGDNDKAIFGAGSDLQIYHDGSNSRIYDVGTGDLRIQGTNLRLQDANGDNFIYAVQGGAVTAYHNGSAKLATTATGIDVTGNATFADNGKAIFGAGSDLQIYHDGSNSYITDVGTGNLEIRGENLFLRNPAGEVYIACYPNNYVSLWYDNAPKLATTSTGIDVTGTVTADGLTVDGSATINTSSTSLANFNYFGVTKGSITTDGINLKHNATANMYFNVNSANRMQIEGNGDISFYEDTGTTPALTWDASAQSLNVDGPITADGLTVDGNNNIQINRDGVSSAKVFWNRGSTQDAAIELNASEDLNISVDDAALGGKHLNLLNNNKLGFRLSDGGDISFYEDTGTTPKFFWDASAESLELSNSAASSALKITKGNTTGNALEIINSGESRSIDINHNADGTGTVDDIVRIKNNGTSVFEIDSSGNVGIGTTSPSEKLHLYDTTSSIFINEVASGGGGVASWRLKHGTSHWGAYVGTTDNLIFYDYGASAERMRITSSGSLLVAKSSQADGATAGHEFLSDGRFYHTKSGDHVGRLNRLSTDGDILRFAKDGTTVGSISSFNSDKIVIGTGAVGIGFSVGDGLLPWNTTTNTPSDNSFGLGNPDYRFKDLYLSGGVYLGGTGSANKLDDYEEGTWTPSIIAGGFNSTMTVNTANYTKIGRLVHVQMDCQFTGTGNSAQLQVGGLPYTNLTSGYSSGTCYMQNMNTDFVHGPIALVDSNSTRIVFQVNRSTSVIGSTMIGSEIDAGYMQLSVTYQVAT